MINKRRNGLNAACVNIFYMIRVDDFFDEYVPNDSNTRVSVEYQKVRSKNEVKNLGVSKLSNRFFIMSNNTGPNFSATLFKARKRSS